MARHAAISVFQSAPADGRRENYDWQATRFWIVCFNPLPPTVGGRIRRRFRRLGGRLRFNPLPPTVGGRIRLRMSSSNPGLAFQSAPADGRRENVMAAPIAPPPVTFQSAPADGRRENDLRAHADLDRFTVSIRSRRRSAGE